MKSVVLLSLLVPPLAASLRAHQSAGTPAAATPAQPDWHRSPAL
ncbi:MAG TPA: hypothetical protein VFY71_16870 [Planctomycetota bacterium]|nr:hypothetical protein [Planctomycetota bacterium]